jgi:type VI secretion system protein VasG
VKLIVSRCTELESGGRMIDAILTNTLLPRISRDILTNTLDGKPLSRIDVSVDQGEFAYKVE